MHNNKDISPYSVLISVSIYAIQYLSPYSVGTFYHIIQFDSGKYALPTLFPPYICQAVLTVFSEI